MVEFVTSLTHTCCCGSGAGISEGVVRLFEANRSELVLSQSQKTSIKLSKLDFILCSQNNSCNDGFVRWESYGKIKVIFS